MNHALRLAIKKRIDPYTKVLTALRPGATVIDIGCANHSPKNHKEIRPDIVYNGVDIDRSTLDAEDERAASQIVILPPSTFAPGLEAAFAPSRADLVTMKHVIEHVDNPFGTLRVAIRLLNAGGLLYLAFPSEKSLHSPSAQGTLNFYDDPTHVWLPDVQAILRTLKEHNLTVETLVTGWGHPLMSAVGFFEYRAQRMRQTLWGTPLVSSPFLWSLFGFETIVVARRVNGVNELNSELPQA
jgi:ubiquinone/menaquinone biosynthesis C-methylase UbiE